MNQMEIFNNPEFGSIRVIEENGKYLFCGSDVAGALGYSNPRDALRRHCKGVVKRDTLTDGGLQQLSFYARRRCVPPDRSQQIAIGRTV